jgi:hypothetical protein
VQRGLRHPPSFFVCAGLAIGGALAVGIATRAQPNALALLPGMDGCLTAGVVAFGLALLHGLSYQAALGILAPIAVIQAIGAASTGASVPAVLGVEAVVVGLVGCLLRARAPSHAAHVGSRAVPVLEKTIQGRGGAPWGATSEGGIESHAS